MRGAFIVLEGGEGAGKSTVRNFLREHFAGALFSREPGGTPLAEHIRELMISSDAANASAETLFSLAWAARFDHVKKVIRPALARGVRVVSERFDASTYAYQVMGQEAPHLKPLFFEYRKLLGNAVPDLYIFLDVPSQVGLRRMAASASKGAPDHFESSPLAFHRRVREGYKEFFKSVPHVVIDAARPLEAVRGEVFSLVSTYLRP